MSPRDLVRWLRSAGLSQAAAARLIGVSEAAVSRWVNGSRPIPEPVSRLIEKIKGGGR